MAQDYLAIWEFEIKPDFREKFEEIYGPGGAWHQLFRRSADYRGTALVRDLDRPGHYLTLDRWTSREALLRFKQDHHAAYAALDEQCETLTERELFLGGFQNVESEPGS